MSGLQGSPSTSAIERPWSGRLRGRESPASSSNVSYKGKENVDDAPKLQNLSAGHDDGGESSGFEHSLDDEEFGIPSVKKPGVRRLQAQGSDRGPHRSTRARNPMQC